MMSRRNYNRLLLSATAMIALTSAGNAYAQDAAGVPSPAPILNDAGAVPMPPEGDLSAAQPAAADPAAQQPVAATSPTPSLPGPEGAVAGATPAPGAPASDAALSPDAVAAIQGSDPADDVFYDADAVLLPEGEMARSTPRKIDPTLEPASRVIIVRKGAAGDTRQAGLVAASRAIKLGRYSSALEIYNDLHKRNSKDAAVLMGRAVALQKMGHTDEAISAYEAVLSQNENNIEARTNMLGLMAEHYPAVAIRQLVDLREKNPDNVGILAQLAVAEGRLGNYENALKYLGIAASLEPSSAGHIFNMAVIADQAGLKKDAIRYYEQALEVDTIYGGNRSIPRDSVFTRLAQLR